MADNNTTTTKHIALECMQEAQSWIESRKEQFIENMKADLAEKIKANIKERNATNVDNILVAAIVLATDQNAEKVITKVMDVNKKLSAQNIDNIVLTATFFDLDTKYLFGGNSNVEDKTFPRRLDKVTKLVEDSSGESSSGTNEVGFGLSWDNVNSWDWVNFIEPLNINFTGNQKITELKSQLGIFAKICYTYDAIRSAAGSSSFDSLNSDLAFPFTEDQLNQVTYTSAFVSARTHPVTGETRAHYGVDLAAPSGTEIHSAADGVVSAVLDPNSSNGGGNYMAIQHADNIYTLYMHMNDLMLSAGTKVSKGQIIGHVGSTGLSTGPHLHFQTNVGGLGSSCAKDPATYFSRLGACPVGTVLGSYKD